MSTWTEFIAETQNVKIAVFEIDIPTEIPFWLNEHPGVWKYQYRNTNVNTQLGFEIGSFCYGNFKFNGIENTGTNAIYRKISSFAVNGVQWTKTTSLANCKNTSNSFFYDETTTILYVNGDVFNKASVEAGVSYGFATYAVYLDNVYYEPRIDSIPNVSISVDDLYFGIRKYSSGTVVMYNHDGYFDGWDVDTIFGQECRIKLGGKKSDGTVLGYDDYKTLFTGYVQSILTTPTKMTITVGDKKDKIGRTLPVNHFSSTDYPDINDNNEGKPIPLTWGVCKKVPCVCVNEDTTTSPVDYKFVIADITYRNVNALSNVYIDNVKESSTPSLTNDSTNDIAYFEISSTGNYSPGQEVSADITGANVLDALDQVKDIFDDYLSISYTTDNFDTTEWNAESANDHDQGIAIIENTKISEILEKTSNGHLGVFFQKGDGRWTFRTIDDSATKSLTINLDEIFNEPNSFKDGKQFLSSATIKFGKRHAPGRWREYTDTTSEQAVFNEFGYYRTQEFETYLSQKADAQTIATAILTEYKTIRAMFDITTTIAAADLYLYDTVDVEINRKNSTWLGTVKCRVMGITYLLRNPMQIKLKLKYIEDVA
jgi:hypothetical protein